ncbi:MFS transporter [Actinoplanes sp. NPDC026619]|uniref:MFS transporter n=1 Tax=Actinoplanes sp. NPDC026619 TaxID=3155798 RepID=UPI0033E59CAA
MSSQTITPAVRHAWLTALVLAGAMFLVLFDSLAVATALPAIGAEFRIAPASLQWVVTGYSLSIGGFLVLAGRVCDLWGRRRLIVASLALTAAGLLVSGVAPGFALLLTGRAMQGVGAAFAIPAALASAATLFPGEPWRSRVFSVVAAAANTAGLAGAVCGGLITSYLGWRWIFLVVLPVAAAAVPAALLILSADHLPPSRPGTAPADERSSAAAGPAAADERLSAAAGPAPADQRLSAAGGPVPADQRAFPAGGPARGDQPAPLAGGRLDVVGAVLATGGLLGVILGATRIGEQGLRWATVLPVMAGLVMLMALVRWERRVPHPLIKASVVRSPRLVASCLAFGAHSAAYAVVVVVGSLQLQDSFRLSAAQAGLVLEPVLLGALISAVPAAGWVRRWGTRRVVALALTLCTVMLALIAVSSAHSLALLAVCLIAWGFSAGPIYVGLTRECIGDAAPEDRGMASALFESTTHVGGAVSVAVFLTMIGAGLSYSSTQFLAAAVVGASVISTLLVMPARSAT